MSTPDSAPVRSVLSPASAVIIGVSFILGLALCVYIAGSHYLAAKRMEEYVTVKGLSEREVDADLVLWPVSFRVNAETLSDLQKEMEKGRGIIQEFLKSNGFDASEMSNSAPSITDTYEGLSTKAKARQQEIPAQQQSAGESDEIRMPRYRADLTVLLRTTKIADVKKALEKCDALVQQGIALRYARPEFNFTGLNKIKPDMIQEANIKAREAAQKFGMDSHSKVGRIRHATQGTFEVLDVDDSAPERKLVRVVTTVDFYLD
ncbi:SIMPL domain-containing protein [Verrucomicrobia bacterium LW23]|nr:SIMPL domain-containing protein [Verrucomicrobia bacterium LW23]